MVELVKRLSLYIFFGLLAYMPLHIFLSTWLGTSFGILEFTKTAKDMVLVVGFGLALAASINQSWFKEFIHNRLVWLILAYAALALLLAALKPTDTDAELLGIVYNLRFLVFFLYGGLLAKLFNSKLVRKQTLTVVFSVATMVLFFGILQYTLLPNGALEHAGYSRTNGVFPAFFIDDKPDLERVMSTLRDPNSFGSYIIIIGMLSIAFLLKSRDKQVKRVALGLTLLSGLCLLFTFSRSAWLGFLVGLGVLVIVGLRKNSFLKRNLKTVLLIAVACLVVGLTLLITLRNTYLVQNIVFHADESTVLEDPNELRTRFWQESVDTIAKNPLGHGPGTAGLTSIRNNVQGTVLNENYYLQIAHEVGVIGLILFLAVVAIVGQQLFKQSAGSTVAIALLASLAGLMVTNFLVHIWSNEAVAYTWWGLAGLMAFLSQKVIRKS